MNSRTAPEVPDEPWEIADGVYCVGPSGRTQSNVFFVRSSDGWALVDAGWAPDAPRIAAAARVLCGTSLPSAIVLTHCHPDHSGAALELATAWGCPVYMHPAELPIATGDFSAMVEDAGPLDRWVVLPMLRLMGRRRREAIIARSSLASVARVLDLAAPVPGMTGWSCIPTPGHTPGHTSFFRPADGVLISGDALVTLRLNSLPGLLLKRQGLSGPPWYTTWSVAASKASINSLIALSPKVLAGGHGMPRTDAHLASELARFV